MELMFVLDENDNPVPEPDSAKWAKWYESYRGTHVLPTTPLPSGNRVSTVFLGLDYGDGQTPPILYESMVFRGKTWQDVDCRRYATKQEAAWGHMKLVAEHWPLGEFWK